MQSNGGPGPISCTDYVCERRWGLTFNPIQDAQCPQVPGSCRVISCNRPPANLQSYTCTETDGYKDKRRTQFSSNVGRLQFLVFFVSYDYVIDNGYLQTMKYFYCPKCQCIVAALNGVIFERGDGIKLSSLPPLNCTPHRALCLVVSRYLDIYLLFLQFPRLCSEKRGSGLLVIRHD